MIVKIYLDLDGVLADFDSWRESVARRNPAALTDDDLMWEEARRVDHFYLNLPLMPNARAFVGAVLETGIPVEVLTALPKKRRIEHAEEDKREYMRRHFCEPLGADIPFNIGPFSEDKQDWARPGHVLIDDRRLNIVQWISKGGTGILFRDAIQVLQDLEFHISERP